MYLERSSYESGNLVSQQTEQALAQMSTPLLIINAVPLLMALSPLGIVGSSASSILPLVTSLVAGFLILSKKPILRTPLSKI